MQARTRSTLTIFTLYGLLCLLVACASPEATTHPRHGHAGAEQESANHHRRPIDIQQYLAHLDRPERDEYQQPAQVIEALRLSPGMTIADLGAGSGYFTRRFVDALHGKGRIYAIDVEQGMLDYIQTTLEGYPDAYTVSLRLAKADDPGLPPQSVDLVFLCNVFHHLEDRPVYFATLKSSLKPSGRIAIIDFYDDHRSGDVGFPRRHLVARDTVLAEMEQAGYKLVNAHKFLTRQYFLEFEPAAP